MTASSGSDHAPRGGSDREGARSSRRCARYREPESASASANLMNIKIGIGPNHTFARERVKFSRGLYSPNAQSWRNPILISL